MVDQNKKIDDYVEISLTPFRRPDGSVVLIAADGSTINLTDSDGNLILALSNYYTKDETYSQQQINALFDNYYTKAESQALFLVAGQPNPGPIIISSSSSTISSRVTTDGLFVYEGSDYSKRDAYALEYYNHSNTDFNPSYYKVSNSVTEQIVFMTDTQGNFRLSTGNYVNEISDDGTLADNSDFILPTQKSVKTYVDGIFTGNVPVTGSSGDFNIDGDLTFSNGNTVRGLENNNEIIFVSGTLASQYKIQGRSGLTDFSSVTLRENETIIANASGSPMLTITPYEVTAMGGVKADSIELSEGDPAWSISSDVFDITGTAFAEDQTLPTQAGVRQHVVDNAVDLVFGGTVGVSGDTVTILPTGITVETSGATLSGAYYGPTSIDVLSGSVDPSGEAFRISVAPSSGGGFNAAIRFNDAGQVALENDVYVNEITNDPFLEDAGSDQLVTAEAVKTYVNTRASMFTESVVGTSYTVPASAGEVYVGADTTSGPFTVFLPVGADLGTRVWVKDESGNASANNITVDGQGQDIDGLPTNIMAVDGLGRIFVFTESFWQVFGI